jgi:peptide chain release factor 1
MSIDITPLIERMRTTFAGIEASLADPAIFDDRKRYEETSREHQRLSLLLADYDALAGKRTELADSTEMIEGETDDEMRELIAAEIDQLTADVAQLETAVMAKIMPPGENDSRNSIVEIRPAAGGDEAALFAGDLFRMYTRFAELRGWKHELLALSETDLGGIRDVSFSLTGGDVYRFMQFESGVHRVQRVPTTETSGRIHTSTVTVAVLPEAQEIDIEIRQEDVRMDVFRSSGPGGQSVNTTDSAVRLTHEPTGVSVASQQEKSQHRNREIAMRILRARLLEKKQREEHEKQAAERRSQVGTGDRSERIRTYNFPQNRVTDHRYAISVHNLPGLIAGDLGGLLEQIVSAENARRLEAEVAVEEEG